MCTPTTCIVRGRRFGQDGCQVPVGNGICGEKRTLEFIDEFKKLFAKKMAEIDAQGGGDCMQEKLRLQQEWIDNLIEQNEMLVKAVGELEVEATDRVHMLEEKLQRSAQCICEEEGKIKKHECTIEELRKKIDYFNSFGNVEKISKDLKSKIEECDDLKKSMVDMRQTLTEEVAVKHDVILQLKSDFHQLEERCIEYDKQIAFKEDIIKELREEIKQLKRQIYLPEKPFKSDPIPKGNVPKPDTCIVINQSKKVIRSGRSTVIYLTHNDEEVKSTSKMYEVHSNICISCKQKVENNCFYSETNDCKAVNASVNRIKQSSRDPEVKELIPSTEGKKSKRPAHQDNLRHVSEIDKSLLLCKSENDLTNCSNETKPIKERSKFTTSTFTRCKTIVGRKSDCFNAAESTFKKNAISIPNHMPVRTYVNNIECNKSF